MVELHGWANIREHYRMPDDDSDERLEQIVETIKEKVARYQWHNGLIDFRAVNDHHHLSMNLFTNHRDGRISEAVDLFRWIAMIAPGSYGLLYIQDDEDDKGNDNVFVVHVLAKGKLIERTDEFLSPCIPVVEELPT